MRNALVCHCAYVERQRVLNKVKDYFSNGEFKKVLVEYYLRKVEEELRKEDVKEVKKGLVVEK